MSNSNLICYVNISPNKTSPRNDKIRKITIHHMAGNATIENVGRQFADPNRQGSANYGIGSDGRIGLYVDEKDRAWTSSSPANDNQAITIEVANDGGSPEWHVSDTALESLINLCVDICLRNGIEKLNYTGDTSGNLTMHSFFVATACPGPYLKSKFPYIAEEVNKRLSKEGWIGNDADGWQYYENGSPIKNKWVKDSVDWCYIGADGYAVKNQWVEDSHDWCYLGADYRIVRSTWQKDSQDWCFVNEHGYLVRDKWVEDSVGWCYVDGQGHLVRNAWQKDSVGLCYLDGEGHQTKNEEVTVKINSEGYAEGINI